MKVKSILLICLLTILGFLPLSASVEMPNQLDTSTTELVEANRRQSNNTCSNWFNQNRLPNRISFATRSGFVLVRKEDIISLSVVANEAGFLLKYRKDGLVNSIHCQATLSKAASHLKEFPFAKISRSAIVNFEEVVGYEGTRRSANLVMSNGENYKISRSKSGDIFDWFSKKSV